MNEKTNPEAEQPTPSLTPEEQALVAQGRQLLASLADKPPVSKGLQDRVQSAEAETEEEAAAMRDATRAGDNTDASDQ